MQLVDRPQFDELFRRLCAGLNTPPTKHRNEALWTGLRKMSLVQFERVVDRGLEEDGLEEVSTKAIWRIHRHGRASGPSAVQASAIANPEPDHLEWFANRLLFDHIAARGGLGPELAEARRVKRSLVDEFLGYIREGDEMATPAAYLRSWKILLKRISPIERNLLERWDRWIQDPEANVPFGPHMARDLGKGSERTRGAAA